MTSRHPFGSHQSILMEQSGSQLRPHLDFRFQHCELSRPVPLIWSARALGSRSSCL
jgi:hypothetical protein